MKKSKAVSVDNIFMMIVLIVFNVLFVLHVILGLAGVILGFIAGAFGMMVGGAVGFLFSLIYPFVAGSWVAGYVSTGGVHPVGMAFLSVAVFCFGGLWMIGNYFIAKYFVKGLSWYWKLNVRAFKRYEI